MQQKKQASKWSILLGKPSHNVRKPSWDPFIPISTYTKLIVPLCEAKAQEVELDFMIWFKFKQLICERLPFGRVVLSFANWDQLQIKEQSE